MRNVSIEGHEIREGGPVFVVAEAGSNHNGDIETARLLIEQAATAGADAVKFQLFKADSLYPRTCGEVETPMGRVDLYETLERFALPEAWIPNLTAHAHKVGLVFLCTPFDIKSVDYLAASGVPAFKIASPELNHLPLLRAAASYQKPIICSTGLGTMSDIEEALETIKASWPDPDVILLQCVSSYPTPVDQSNLGAIPTMRRAFGFPVGLSDHTMDSAAVPAMAVLMGACMIEKHFTLSRSLSGPDHPFSLEPGELADLVRIVRKAGNISVAQRMTWVTDQFGKETVDGIIGHGRKEIMPAESELYPNDKRSIVAIAAIEQGDLVSDRNVAILRSERNLRPGLHPRYWEKVIGSQSVRAIDEGSGFDWADIAPCQK
jgi:sialic acid synthase SpsE